MCSVVRLIAEHLDYPNNAVRLSALQALRRIPHPDAELLLVHAFENDLLGKKVMFHRREALRTLTNYDGHISKLTMERIYAFAVRKLNHEHSTMYRNDLLHFFSRRGGEHPAIAAKALEILQKDFMTSPKEEAESASQRRLTAESFLEILLRSLIATS